MPVQMIIKEDVCVKVIINCAKKSTKMYKLYKKACVMEQIWYNKNMIAVCIK